MKFSSWNVNGLRACLKKGFEKVFETLDCDAVCLQEIKLQEGQIRLDFPGYESYWNYAEKKGYSGTAIYTRIPPIHVLYDIGNSDFKGEGRSVTLEFPDYFLVNVYTPNSQDGLRRLDYRMAWEDAFRSYLCSLDRAKPVIVCGDMNVAHREIDLKNPSSNRGNPGFSDEEREKFSALLSSGFTDTFRYLYPEEENAYSWWSYRASARERNVGWRIDYFLISDRMRSRIKNASIHAALEGSDHCPVSLELKDEKSGT